jgi:hypothetical protein
VDQAVGMLIMLMMLSAHAHAKLALGLARSCRAHVLTLLRDRCVKKLA